MNGDMEISTFSVQLTLSRIYNLTLLTHTLAMRDDRTYILRITLLGVMVETRMIK